MGLLTVGFPQAGRIKPVFLGGGYVEGGGRLISHDTMSMDLFFWYS